MPTSRGATPSAVQPWPDLGRGGRAQAEVLLPGVPRTRVRHDLERVLAGERRLDQQWTDEHVLEVRGRGWFVLNLVEMLFLRVVMPELQHPTVLRVELGDDARGGSVLVLTVLVRSSSGDLGLDRRAPRALARYVDDLHAEGETVIVGPWQVVEPGEQFEGGGEAAPLPPQ
jgi:hypothetical protein